MDTATFLKGTLLGQGLDEAELSRLAALFVERSYAANQGIFKEGEPSNELYIVKSGAMKIVKHTSGGRKEVLVTLKPGDMFGEMAFLDGRPRSAGAEALEDMEVILFDRSKYSELVKQKDFLAFKIVSNIARMLTSRLRRTTERLAEE